MIRKRNFTRFFLFETGTTVLIGWLKEFFSRLPSEIWANDLLQDNHVFCLLDHGTPHPHWDNTVRMAWKVKPNTSSTDEKKDQSALLLNTSSWPFLRPEIRLEIICKHCKLSSDAVKRGVWSRGGASLFAYRNFYVSNTVKVKIFTRTP